MKKIFLLAFIASSFFCNAQTTVDTTINGWTAIITYPDDYFTAADRYYPAIVFFPGAGEAGGTHAQLRTYGPHARIANSSWNGTETIGNGVHKFILVSLSQSPTYDVNSNARTRVNTLLSFLRIKTDGLAITGLSAGGHCAGIMATEDAFDNVAPYGPFSFADGISAIFSAQGVQPDDNADYLNKFKNFARNNRAGRYLGIWGSADGSRMIPEIAASMNAAVPGSAVVVATADAHNATAFNNYYGKTAAPLNYSIDGVTQNIYQWLLRQMDTTQYTPAPSNCNELAPVSYTQSATAAGEIYITNAKSSKPWKGGDTVTIAAGTYSVLHIDSLRGDACRRLFIRFQPGVIVNGPIRFNYAEYVDINGYDATQTARRYCSPKGVSISLKKVKELTCEYVEIGPNPSGVGVYCKIDVNPADPSTWRSSGYVMKNIKLKHLWIHDVEGEVIYAGHTSPTGDAYNPDSLGNLIPAILMDSVEISYCYVERSGWDGIQLSGAGNGAWIHHNTVTDFGLLDIHGQRAGIILGSLSNGSIHDNIVKRGWGNGIQAFGYGVINIYNNTIDSVAKTRGDSNTVTHQWKGEQSFYGDDRANEDKPALQVNFYNNHITHVSPYENGAVSIPNGGLTMGLSSVTNNTFTIPGADASWKTKHIKLYPGFTNTNNTLTNAPAGGLIILPYLRVNIKFN